MWYTYDLPSTVKPSNHPFSSDLPFCFVVALARHEVPRTHAVPGSYSLPGLMKGVHYELTRRDVRHAVGLQPLKDNLSVVGEGAGESGRFQCMPIEQGMHSYFAYNLTRARTITLAACNEGCGRLGESMILV